MIAFLAAIPLRMWLYAAAIGAALAALGWAVHHEREVGREEVRAEWNADKAKQERALVAANAAARAKEQALQSKVTGAINAANDREKILRSDAVRARAQRDGLRDDLATARANLSSASPASLRQRVAAAEDVFEQCVREYSGLAEEAGRQSSDSLMLQQAWPR